MNGSSRDCPSTDAKWSDMNWWVLGVCVPIVVLTVLGNTLVCVTVSRDKRLQTTTNYFLLSLAITDLLLALVVMPIGILVLLYGYFPYSSSVCLVWTIFDVLLCTASILHMCTLSIDRYLSLSYPFWYGIRRSPKHVIFKLAPVWLISVGQSACLCVVHALDHRSLVADGVCGINNLYFQLFGSILCFYIPLLVIVTTYALTMRSLHRQGMQHSEKRRGASMPVGGAHRLSAWLCAIRRLRPLSMINARKLPDASHRMMTASLSNMTSSSCKPLMRHSNFTTVDELCRIDNCNDNCYQLTKNDNTGQSFPALRRCKSSWNVCYSLCKNRSGNRRSMSLPCLCDKHVTNCVDNTSAHKHRTHWQYGHSARNKNRSASHDEASARSNGHCAGGWREHTTNRQLLPIRVTRKPATVNIAARRKTERDQVATHGRTRSVGQCPNTRHCCDTNTRRQKKRYATVERIDNKRIRSEKRVLYVLGAVCVTFVLLWSPFFVINVVTSLCVACRVHISGGTVSLVTWLGYTSSLFNPLFYTLFSKNFRRAFANILGCQYG